MVREMAVRLLLLEEIAPNGADPPMVVPPTKSGLEERPKR
jgi:hypothetical protein